MNERVFLILLSLLSAIGGFLFGYDTGVISGALVLIKDDFHLSDVWQEAIVASTVGVAGLFSLLGGALNELCGRKPVIMSSSLIFVVGAVVMAISPDKEVLLVGRIVVGVGLGLASVTSPMYIGEVAPASIRGNLVVMNTAMITGGQLVASVVAGLFSGDTENGWRYMLGLAAIPALIQLIGFTFMPESPVWLMVKKDHPDYCKSVLMKIREEEEVLEELDQLIMYKEKLQQEPKTFQKLQIMVRNRSTRRALITGSMMQILQQLSGINTFMYYSASILLSSGIGTTSEVIWLAVIPAAANFIFTFAGMALIERIGRRKLGFGSLALAAVGLICLSGSYFAMETDDPQIPIPQNTSVHSNCFTAPSCSSCLSKSECGFCFHENNDGVFDFAFCLPYHQDDDDFSELGACSNQSEMSTDSLTWTHDYCPSQYAFLTVISMVIYLAGFASGMGPLPWVANAEIYPIWGRGVGGGISTTCNWTNTTIGRIQKTRSASFHVTHSLPVY
ncbi:proton myo-inositol cotransporter-like isoform X2 [Convolutriloba macropyga]|uniref:proton myo-inositol cotransporter-like isoform X2 n=1 Tax=Convolutriloba macropyga TaxID=536237 RepID=UPI003F528B45